LSFSQTILTPRLLNDSLVVISLPQLKKTNLIFLEHRKFKSMNEVMSEQIKHLGLLNVEYERIDSIQKAQLIHYNSIVNHQSLEITDLNKSLNSEKKKSKTKNYIIGGAVFTSILLILITSLK
jgi:hypothetical protein